MADPDIPTPDDVAALRRAVDYGTQRGHGTLIVQLSMLRYLLDSLTPEPVGGAAMCDHSESPIARKRLLAVIEERLGWYRDNLAGWNEIDGYLLPTEPDPGERRRTRECLVAAIETLEELKRHLVL